jgi:DNA-binding CsgD family transcriptional regulator
MNGLTPTETQVMNLVLQGMTAKEIAKHMDRAPHTIKCHIDTAKAKLQAKNIAQAAVLFDRAMREQ